MEEKHKIILKKDGLTFSLLDNNYTEQILFNDLQINAYRGNHLFGSVSNIYLRFRDEDLAFSLIENGHEIKFGKDFRIIKGEVNNIHFRLLLYLASENLWFYDLSIDGKADNLDVIFLQDLALSHPNNVLNNELYLSQYLDHKIFKINEGYHLCSRQNMGSPNPLITHGALNIKIARFATDATQWFGSKYKITKRPILLTKDLPNINYQYELGAAILQTEKFHLQNKKRFSFYAFLIKDQINPFENIDFLDDVYKEYLNFLELDLKVKKEQKRSKIHQNIDFSPLICRNLTENEINYSFGHRLFEEIKGDKLLSFFTKDYSHVVLQNKEEIVERPTGHIITNLNSVKNLDLDLLTSTNYSYGLFNAQVSSGNTSMNKFLSAHRGLLNINQISGQRIFIKLKDKYQILGVPSSYEMGLNFAKWYYAFNEDLIEIKVYMTSSVNKINFVISSKLNLKYDFLITNQIVMGEHEYQNPYKMEIRNESLIFTLDDNTYQKTKYPNLTYKINILNTPFEVHSDQLFYQDNIKRDSSLVIIKIRQISKIQMTILGTSLSKDINDVSLANFEVEKNNYHKYYRMMMNEFTLNHQNNLLTEKLNTASLWFTHNALVHYASPHGLEQSGGAAWGTRDVCQGPLELFLATNNFLLAKDIILRVFSYQNKASGQWPQWFFLDEYRFASDSCHGDIIFWPLKALADYLKVTNDTHILFEEVPYFDEQKTETILNHLEQALLAIEKRFIIPYDLISFAGGDWNDTLQPAKKEMEKSLVSTWTQALAFQSCSTLYKTLKDIKHGVVSKLEIISNRIKIAFQKYCFASNIIPGFIQINNGDSLTYLLHPKDKETGIRYRLLPLTRSMLAELVSDDDVVNFNNIIDEHLIFPDGVRLMDRPPKYFGGQTKFFIRAEQASNVGRELSLLYMHAHLRYVEAMTKINEREKAYQSLLKVIPLSNNDVVANSLPRQANAYFSSSDGLFFDRYDFQNNFKDLKNGLVNVRGGWRIYSSGPGIFMKILINDFIGLKFEDDNLVIAPSLPLIFNGLSVNFKINDKIQTFLFHIKNERYAQISAKYNNKTIKSHQSATKYGKTTLKIPLSFFIKVDSVIDIYLS